MEIVKTSGRTIVIGVSNQCVSIAHSFEQTSSSNEEKRHCVVEQESVHDLLQKSNQHVSQAQKTVQRLN